MSSRIALITAFAAVFLSQASGCAFFAEGLPDAVHGRIDVPTRTFSTNCTLDEPYADMLGVALTGSLAIVPYTIADEPPDSPVLPIIAGSFATLLLVSTIYGYSMHSDCENLEHEINDFMRTHPDEQERVIVQYEAARDARPEQNVARKARDAMILMGGAYLVYSGVKEQVRRGEWDLNGTRGGDDSGSSDAGQDPTRRSESGSSDSGGRRTVDGHLCAVSRSRRLASGSVRYRCDADGKTLIIVKQKGSGWVQANLAGSGWASTADLAARKACGCN